jgi:hypothetical protein
MEEERQLRVDFSPDRPARAARCAQRTAGVHVNRSLEMATVDVAVGGFCLQSPSRDLKKKDRLSRRSLKMLTAANVQRAESATLVFALRKPAKPRPAKPSSIIAQVAGSGTPPVVVNIKSEGEPFPST